MDKNILDDDALILAEDERERIAGMIEYQRQIILDAVNIIAQNERLLEELEIKLLAHAKDSAKKKKRERLPKGRGV